MEIYGTTMTYNALRKGRVSIPGQIYLLTAVTWDRTPWCQDFRLGREVAGVLHGVAVAYPGLSLAWVVMPDHMHWLVQLPDGVSLERLMQIFKGRSARALNVAGLRTGDLALASLVPVESSRGVGRVWDHTGGNAGLTSTPRHEDLAPGCIAERLVLGDTDIPVVVLDPVGPGPVGAGD